MPITARLMCLVLLTGCTGTDLFGGGSDADAAGPDAGADDAGDAGPDADGGNDAADVAADPSADLGADGASDADAAADLDAADARDAGDGGDGDGGSLPESRTTYVTGRVHSLLTPAVVAHLRAIAAVDSGLSDEVFMKVGDSISIAQPFMHCLADPAVDLEGRSDLDETRAYFAATDDLPGGASSFDRESAATLGGRTAAWAVTAVDGTSPLEAERVALDPRFAVVMFGTNDIGYWPDDFPRMFNWYGEHMLVLVDELTERGVVPLLSSIPPRLDSPSVLDPRVASMNALVWGIAQSWQLPYVDYHLALAPLAPTWGLSPLATGGDGVHPTSSCDGGVRCGCRFDETGLHAGYNVRNWVTLEALDRVRRALVAGEPAPDAPQLAPLAGAGSATDPFVIAQLPFADYRDTRDAPNDALDEYTGCSATQNESGPEWLYTLDLAETTDLGLLVVDRAGVDVDVHVLGDEVTENSCLARDDTFLELTLGPGRYIIALDTWVNGATELGGEYLFVVHER